MLSVCMGWSEVSVVSAEVSVVSVCMGWGVRRCLWWQCVWAGDECGGVLCCRVCMGWG